MQEKISQAVNLDDFDSHEWCRENREGRCGAKAGARKYCGLGKYCSCYGWCGPKETHFMKECYRRKNYDDQYSWYRMPYLGKEHCYYYRDRSKYKESTDLEELSESEQKESGFSGSDLLIAMGAGMVSGFLGLSYVRRKEY